MSYVVTVNVLFHVMMTGVDIQEIDQIYSPVAMKCRIQMFDDDSVISQSA